MKKGFCTRAVADRAGATSMEYGLITAVLSVALFSGVGLIGESLATNFTEVAVSIETVTQAHPGAKTASIAYDPEMFAVDVVGSIPEKP